MLEDKGEGEFVTMREIVNYFEQQFDRQHREYMTQLKIIRWLYIILIIAMVATAFIKAP